MTWAMDQQFVTDAPSRHVLLCLANYADHNGKAAFPSTSTLERDTGLSESTIRRRLDSLEAMGIIEKGNQAIVAAYIDRNDRRPVCYDICIKKQPGVSVLPRDERGVTETGAGCQRDANGVSQRQERGVSVTPNTSSNPSSNPSKNQKRSSDRAVALVAGGEKTATTLTGETWNAYAAAYEQRYGTAPVRNATVNAQMANFVKRLGAAEAPAVAAFYVSHNNRFYVQSMHSAGQMAKDAEKLRTEWATRTRMTAERAAQMDRTATNGDVFAKLIAEAQSDARHG
jgi:hypothetical protein